MYFIFLFLFFLIFYIFLIRKGLKSGNFLINTENMAKQKELTPLFRPFYRNPDIQLMNAFS